MLHSWWLLRALCAVLAFFYIGHRAKNKNRLKYGLIYFIILAIAYFLPLWIISRRRQIRRKTRPAH